MNGSRSVAIYDSLPTGNISSRTKEQIASICFCADKEIHLEFPDVQRQRGGSNCGLFALAFAATLCAGGDPSEQSYVQHKLREHLISCLEGNHMRCFPARSRKRTTVTITCRKTIPVFCICRQPSDGRMAQCCSCLEWFHEDCQHMPQEVWKKKDYVWKCTDCTKY